MYCYHCGNKIYNKMLHCPYCENEIEDMSKMLFENTINELSLQCPILDETEKMEFDIKGIPTITIADKLYVCCTIRAFCQKIFTNTCDKVKEYIKSTEYDMIDRNGYSYFEDLSENIAYVVVAFCKRNNKFEEFDSWENSKYSFVLDINSLWDVVQGVKDEFASMEASIRAKQNEIRNRKRTTRWVGGGIGLRGAIIGSIQADILNTAGDAFRSVSNKTSSAVVGGIGSLQVDKERDKFKNSKLFWRKMESQLHKYFEEIEIFLLKEFGAYTEQYKTARQLKCFSEYQDYEDLGEAIAAGRLHELIFDANAYVSLYKNDKSRGMELYRLAKFCCVDEKVMMWFIQWGDKDFFNCHSVEQIGYDTDVDTLRRWKGEIVELEANNFAYKYGISGSEKMSTIHKKVDELLMEFEVKERRQMINDTFANNKMGDAINKLLEKNDEKINWLVFFYTRLDFAKNVDITQCVGAQYPMIIEAYWLNSLYTNQRPKILKLVNDKVRVWSPYAYSFLALTENDGKKGYKYNRENLMFHVWEGAKKHSMQAWWYLGLHHKDEEFQIEENLQIAKIYLKNANRYGVGDRRVLEKLN